jgi:4-amino-4-deoxy-L-arabinose transferase-like glycosyltransferase
MIARLGRFHSRLAIVVVAALVWKLYYLVEWKRGDDNLHDEGDALYYGLQARLNAGGQWYVDPGAGGPGADHPPLTSLVLTPAAWVFDGSVLAMRLTMTLLGAVVIVGVGLLGRRVAGERVGLLASVLAGAYAALWVNDALLMSETLAALGTVATLLAGYRLHDRRDVPSALVFGVTGGLATLARAELALLLPLVGLIVLLVRRPPHGRSQAGEAVRLLGVAAAASVVVVGPWVLWNLARFEEPSLISTNDGLTWAGANCDTTYYTPAIGFWSLDCGLDLAVEGDRSTMSQAWREAAFEYVGDNLDRVPAVTAARLGRTFGVFETDQMVFFNTNEGREPWVSWLALYQYWVLAPVSVAGAVISVRRGLFVAPLVSPAVVVVVVTVVFYGLARFRVPLDVVLVVLAAVAVDAVVGFAHGAAARRSGSRRDPTQPVG